MIRRAFTDIFPRGLIVSCQAPPGDPMDDPQVMACLARSAQAAGAVGIRANGPMNISRVRAQTGLPVIGIHKRDFDGFDVRITPTFALALWTLGRKDEAVQWYAAAVRTEPAQWSTPARYAALLPHWRDEERATLAEVQRAWAANPPAWP